MEALQGRLTGIALPKLICDTPGGRGKVPLVPSYLLGRDDPTPGRATRTHLRTFRGESVSYIDPPALSPAPSRDGGERSG
jgi:lysine 2,3-aminomutase